MHHIFTMIILRILIIKKIKPINQKTHFVTDQYII